MKVVRTIARLNIGGPAIHVVLLTRGFLERGHESLLLVGPVPETEGNMEYYASRYQVPIIRIPELVRPLSPWKDAFALWKIYRILRREAPDVVHTHTSKAGTLARLAAIIAGTPIIFHTFHGSVFDGYFSPFMTRLFLLIERLLARFSDRVVTVSESLRNQLVDVYKIAPGSKTEVVRLGFDLGDFFNVAQSGARGSQHRSPLVIGWVGRFTEIKDPLLFVRLAAALKSSGQSVRFVMIGDGPLRPEVETAISTNGLSADFTLPGWRQDMPNVYREIDLIVSTSINEGTPVTVIEAMATGCPFVAPDVGGLVDLTSGTKDSRDSFDIYANGVIVPRRDVPSLLQAVLCLLSDPQLRIRMGKAGCQFTAENFGQERLIREMESLYIKVAQSKSAVLRNRLVRAPSKP